MTSKTKIKEIFASIQGEGPYIGVKQLFIRFCGCNLNCDYCDTPNSAESNFLEFTPEELSSHIQSFKLNTLHSISLTGGEPLIWADYLLEFLPLINNHKIYLETNATLNNHLEKVIGLIDIISADIKLPSASGVVQSFAFHDEFFKVTQNHDKEVFAKIVFDENILDNEIENCLKLAEKYNLPLILQPKTVNNKILFNQCKILEILDKFSGKYPNTRVIPQVHKLIGVE